MLGENSLVSALLEFWGGSQSVSADGIVAVTLVCLAHG